MNKFWFVQFQPMSWWPVLDPVAWCIDNAHLPLLDPALDRLMSGDVGSDPQRLLNVVLRRCKLNLVEIPTSNRVLQHYWTDLADPRLLFKEQGLARPDVQVALVQHKYGIVVLQPGDKLLYGEKPWHGFRWTDYQCKWDRRGQDEADDWMGATRTNYSWEGMPERWVPWAVLKAIWRRKDTPPCPNCDMPLVLVAFRLNRHLLSSNDSYREWVCFFCRRWFVDWCWGSIWPWLAQHLEPPLLPVMHHGIVMTDLRPYHAEEQLQEARGIAIAWTMTDKRGWEP